MAGSFWSHAGCPRNVRSLRFGTLQMLRKRIAVSRIRVALEFVNIRRPHFLVCKAVGRHDLRQWLCGRRHGLGCVFVGVRAPDRTSRGVLSLASRTRGAVFCLRGPARRRRVCAMRLCLLRLLCWHVRGMWRMVLSDGMHGVAPSRARRHATFWAGVLSGRVSSVFVCRFVFSTREHHRTALCVSCSGARRWCA
jgi:hypothetical protein